MKQSEEGPSGGGYGYGGYYYGEGYGPGLANPVASPSRGIKDYLLMLRERIWWLMTTVFVIFLGVALYTFNAPEIYRANTSLQILRTNAEVTQFDEVANTDVRGAEDLQTQIDILESIQIVRRVDGRIQGELRQRFLAPYEKGIEVTLRGPKSVPQLLMENREIQPERMSLMVRVFYSHPNPEVAAEVANLFAEEFIDFNRNLQLDVSMRAMDELREKVQEQDEKVKEMELRIADFKEKYGTVSVEERQDIDGQELIQLRSQATEAKRAFDMASTLFSQITKVKEQGLPLYELNFINEDPRVSSLLNALSTHKIEIASLSKKYGPKHPKMIAAREAAEQTEAELETAIANKAAGIENEYERAKANSMLAEQRLADKEQEMIALDRIRPAYNALMRDLEVSRGLYNHYYSRYQQTTAMATIEDANARIIDVALPSSQPYKPNIAMNLAIGLVLGVGAGFGLVFLLAMLDDKVKTAFDVESAIGVPLVGIIPRISIVDSLEKARIVENNLDRHTVEAFRAVHSTLNLNEESRKARVILTTSTIPSEGKSFVSTNLAHTFANHGERTLIIDADLRMPNIGKSLNLPNRKGSIQVLAGEATLDEVIVKDYAPNLDLLVAGGRSRNPTQLLSSARFDAMLRELRTRYDRILIDSPPLAPVSDALNVLPLVDGVIYVIRFNHVKRKTAALNLRRIAESDVPVLGAVMNNINTHVAGYYYSHYYDSSYRSYYNAGGSITTNAEDPVASGIDRI